MPTQIQITKVDWANTPSAPQTTTFEYKLFSDTSWTLVSNTAAINVDGTLVIPLTINALTAGQLYYVRWHNNCDSPPDYYTQQFQL
jgi:hypothetical protein